MKLDFWVTLFLLSGNIPAIFSILCFYHPFTNNTIIKLKAIVSKI